MIGHRYHWIYIMTVSLLLFMSCDYKIKIPDNQAGILINRNNGEAKGEIIKSGSHDVDFLTDVILYDITEQHIDFSFDFLFKDLANGEIVFSINYIPRLDSLPNIYNKYGLTVSTSDGTMLHIVTVETMTQIRNLMEKYNMNDLTDDMILNVIEKSLRTENPIAGIIEIKSFSPSSYSKSKL